MANGNGESDNCEGVREGNGRWEGGIEGSEGGEGSDDGRDDRRGKYRDGVGEGGKGDSGERRKRREVTAVGKMAVDVVMVSGEVAMVERGR